MALFGKYSSEHEQGGAMPLLTLRVLGLLQVAGAGTPLSTLESDRARALLAYLAVEADRPHRRETLIGLLWPDCS